MAHGLNPQNQPPQRQEPSASLSRESLENSPFIFSAQQEALRQAARAGYREFANKDPLGLLLMRSALEPIHGLQLDPANPLQRVIVDLLDAPAIQRMKFISQLSAAAWVYPDGSHPRFGHVVGSAYLTADILEHLGSRAKPEIKKEIDTWGPVCVAFAMTHDLGHIAPGSHVAQRVWFKGQPDTHEEMSHRVICEDPGLRHALAATLGPDGPAMLDRLVREDHSVPKWAWQIITGGGWNTDRGDWVRRDGQLLGVGYGQYEVPIIKKNLCISPQSELLIREAGVPALEAFFSARADMYRNVYRHPTSRIGERLHELVGQRARELYAADKLEFADETMKAVLAARTGSDLSVPTIMNMVEHWWEYHVQRWCNSSDPTLRELCGRILRREPFKRFAHSPQLADELRGLVQRSGRDPRYFLVEMGDSKIDLQKDLSQALRVLCSDGTIMPLTEHSPFMSALNQMQGFSARGFLAVPQEIFAQLH